MSGPVKLRERWHCAGTEVAPHAGVYFDEEGHAAPLWCPVCNRILALIDANTRSGHFQRQRAELSDQLNGTPCEQIRHKEQVEELRRNLDDVCSLYERDCTGIVDSRVALIRERNRA